MNIGIDPPPPPASVRGPGQFLASGLRRLAALGADPKDSEDERLRKATMAIVWVAFRARRAGCRVLWRYHLCGDR